MNGRCSARCDDSNTVRFRLGMIRSIPAHLFMLHGVSKSRLYRGDIVVIVTVVLCLDINGMIVPDLQLQRRPQHVVVTHEDGVRRIVCFMNNTRRTAHGIGRDMRILWIITRRAAHLPRKAAIFELFNAVVRQEAMFTFLLEAILFSLFGHPLTESTIAFVVLRNFAAALLVYEKPIRVRQKL